MIIKTEIIDKPQDYIDVTIEDCEGFSVQENMGPADLPEYIDSLMDSLLMVCRFMEMSQEDITGTLKDGGLIGNDRDNTSLAT